MGLEINKVLKGDKVYLRQPKLSEMKLIQFLWGDKATMEAVGGTVELTDEKAKLWYERMIEPGRETDRYFLIFNDADDFIGEVSFHRYNSETKTANFNIKILSTSRGKGYSHEAIKLILDYYFKEFKGEVILDDIAKGNTSGQQALLKFGFEYALDNEDIFLVKMTKERFEALFSS